MDLPKMLAAEMAVMVALTDLGSIPCTWSPGCTHSAVLRGAPPPGPLGQGVEHMVCVHHINAAEAAGYRLAPLYVQPD